MFRYFANTIPEIKEILGLPADHLYSAALFGYPAIEFARTVQRDDAAVVRRISLDSAGW